MINKNTTVAKIKVRKCMVIVTQITQQITGQIIYHRSGVGGRGKVKDFEGSHGFEVNQRGIIEVNRV